MAKFIIGLTGGIGSGKTTVANLFAQQGITLVDADIIARACVAPNTPALQAIIDHFGEQLLTASGMLDRAKLRSIVFSDKTEQQWLNALLHPLIRNALLHELAAATSDYVILVAPLLIENKLTSLVNRILVIDVQEQTQINRTIKRDHCSLAIVQNIMHSQVSRANRLAAADDVLNNDSEQQSALTAQVIALHHQYLALAQQANLA